jgi:hypothetical protein
MLSLMSILLLGTDGVVPPQTRIKLFADDCLLYRTIDTKQDHKQLQQDINTLVDWSHTWLMTFNAAKCHLLKITRKTKFLDTEYTLDNSTNAVNALFLTSGLQP